MNRAHLWESDFLQMCFLHSVEYTNYTGNSFANIAIFGMEALS
jgi:hypothetical protein